MTFSYKTYLRFHTGECLQLKPGCSNSLDMFLGLSRGATGYDSLDLMG